ncbi:MAG: hypothetical protein ABSE93_18210 [Terriglobia bacterium]|jgi:hypothetical protein
MSELWKKFFEQEDFEVRPSHRDGLAVAFHSESQCLSIYCKSGRVWEFKLTGQGDLSVQPDLVHSNLLGASRLTLYNERGDEQAIVCALDGNLCLMLSDPADRFAENRRTPTFYDAGRAETARCAPGPQKDQMWSLNLLTPDGRGFKAGLVALAGQRGYLLLRMMPHS